jgi:hypothetical protein
MTNLNNELINSFRDKKIQIEEDEENQKGKIKYMITFCTMILSRQTNKKKKEEEKYISNSGQINIVSI